MHIKVPKFSEAQTGLSAPQSAHIPLPGTASMAIRSPSERVLNVAESCRLWFLAPAEVILVRQNSICLSMAAIHSCASSRLGVSNSQDFPVMDTSWTKDQVGVTKRYTSTRSLRRHHHHKYKGSNEDPPPRSHLESKLFFGRPRAQTSLRALGGLRAIGPNRRRGEGNTLSGVILTVFMETGAVGVSLWVSAPSCHPFAPPL